MYGNCSNPQKNSIEFFFGNRTEGTGFSSQFRKSSLSELSQAIILTDNNCRNIKTRCEWEGQNIKIDEIKPPILVGSPDKKFEEIIWFKRDLQDQPYEATNE